MNVTCEKCNKRYAIADDKVRGKSVKIRCKQCQNLISVQGPGAPGAVQVTAAAAVAGGVAMGGGALGAGGWDDERTRAMPALDLSPTWFAMVKGAQVGPMTLRDLEQRVKTQEVSLRTYLWKQGMADWKRASDVPEVSPVFAGVSVSTSAAPAPQAAPPPAAARTASRPGATAARDVATSNEVPSPEVTRKTNGNGHPETTEPSAAAPFAPGERSRPKTSILFPKTELPEPSPAGERSGARTPTGSFRAPAAAEAKADPRPSPPSPATPKPESGSPLNELFSDVGNLDSKPLDSAEMGTNPGSPPPGAQTEDPFAALGEADPSQAPPPGEATKFFIAQAGVNKRNPPWKIALFVVAIIGVPVGVLFMLSKLHVGPAVLVTNEKGEVVEQSFFTPEGFSVGIKDLLSGEGKKKKAAIEAQRKAAEAKVAEARRKVPQQPVAENNVDALPGRRDEKREAPKFTDEEYKKLYGSGGVSGSAVNLTKNDVGPRVRLESQPPTIEKGGGLDADAVNRTISERMKAMVGCVEDALKRNPNTKLEKSTLVINVGTSGAVKSVGLEPKRVELTDWGGCIRDRAKKITFPPADSESEIQIPLVLGAAIQ